MIAKQDLPDDLNDLWLKEWKAWTSAAFCRNCGRLWIAWGESEPAAEYVPVDPAVRAVRDSQAEPDDG